MTFKLPLDTRSRRGSAAITARPDGRFDLTQAPEHGGEQLAELVADMQATLSGIGRDHSGIGRGCRQELAGRAGDRS